MKILWILVIACFTLSEFVHSDSYEFNGVKYTFVKTADTYDNQIAACADIGGTIAIMDSTEIREFLVDALGAWPPTGFAYFIGLNRFNPGNENSDFQWNDGRILTNQEAMWASVEPDEIMNTCVVTFDNTFYWEDGNCSVPTNAICQEILPKDECAETTTILAHPSNFSLTSFEGYKVVIAPEKLLSYQLTSDYDFCYPTVPGNNLTIFTFNLTDCFPLVQDDGDYLSYTYTIWAIECENASSVVLRYEDRCMNKTCVYPNEQNKTSDYVVPTIRKFTFDAEMGQGEFNLEFGLYAYANCTFEEPFAGWPAASVKVSDYVFAKITDDVESPEFILQAQSCWASPYEYPYTNVTYPIIVDRCPANNPFDPPNAIEVIKNFNQTILFKFKSFVWTNFTDEDQKIYVHCTVTFCDTSSGEDCTTNACSTRRRRSLDRRDSHVISVGPMSINVNLCENDNGGCEELCTMVNSQRMCSCFGNRIIGEDQRSCIDIEQIVPSLGQGQIYEEATLFGWLIFVILIVGIFVFYIKNKQQAYKKIPM